MKSDDCYSQYTERLLSSKSSFDFVAAHFECENDKFSAENPNGYVNLGSAQNFLGKQAIGERLTTLSWNLEDAPYRKFVGTDSCRGSVANYLGEISATAIDPNNIVIGNGLISLMEALSIAVMNPGDGVLVTTPIFPGLVTALASRTGVQPILLETRPEDAFQLTPQMFRERLEQERARGTNVKAMLLCSPGNPIGQVFSAEEVHNFVELAEEFDLHLIVDEIYASSCFEGVNFYSSLAENSDNVSVIGGLSKDFGLAGFTAAWVHTKNENILTAMRKQSHYFRLSAPMQRAMESILEPNWRRDFIEQNRKQLTACYQKTCEMLEDFEITVTPSQAGLVCWLDLRAFLETLDEANQLSLYRHLLEQHRVHVSPGSGFHFSQSGFFRICFSQQNETLVEGLRRIQQGLHPFSQNQKTNPAGALK